MKQKEAFDVLARIDQVVALTPLQEKRWLEALKAIRWVEDTADGVQLTPDGHSALADFQAGGRKTV